MRLIGLLLQLGCLWPVLHWVVLRSRDGSDEPWSLLALATLAALAVVRRHVRPIDWFYPGLALLAYAVTFPWLTPLPRALLGLLSLALTLSQAWFGKKLHAGVLGLCWLAVPLMASLEFYAGYPLRVVSAELARALIGLSGVGVERVGVNLVANGREVAVDPACSGLKTLWAGAYAASVLGCVMPLRALRSLLCLSAALLLLVAGNGWRTAALFFAETQPDGISRTAHDAVGVVVFMLVLGALAAIWIRVARGQPAAEQRPSGARGGRFFAAACTVAALASFVPRPSQAAPAFAFEGWPSHHEGRPLTELRAPPELAEFERSFPGKVAYFRGGSARYVFRFVTAPTRRLHPAAHCYRASGYAVEDERTCVRNGVPYGCFTARRGDETVHVSELLHGAGGAWTHVSAWYWDAVLGRSKGPWWSVTIAEP